VPSGSARSLLRERTLSERPDLGTALVVFFLALPTDFVLGDRLSRCNNGITGRRSGTLLWEAQMPRFAGRRAHGIWWDVGAVVVLVIIIVVVLQVTGTVDIFGALPGSVLG
jgi:hypothetical protein